MYQIIHSHAKACISIILKQRRVIYLAQIYNFCVNQHQTSKIIQPPTPYEIKKNIY